MQPVARPITPTMIRIWPRACCCWACCRCCSARPISAIRLCRCWALFCACTAEGATNNANMANKTIFRTFFMINFLSEVKGLAETAGKTAQDRSDAFRRWFSSHRPKCCAHCVRRRFTISNAQTPPYGSTPLFIAIGHLHSALPMVCEVNQPSSDGF